MNEKDDFREVVLENLQFRFLNFLIANRRTFGAWNFLYLSLHQPLKQGIFIAYFVKIINSCITFSWHYLLKEIDSNNTQSKEEWDGLHWQPVVKKKAAKESCDKLEYALECISNNEIISLIIQPIDNLIWHKKQANMDQSHHVLVSPFTLSDYNDKVGYKGAHIHKQKDYLSYCEVSSIFFFGYRHYLN